MTTIKQVYREEQVTLTLRWTATSVEDETGAHLEDIELDGAEIDGEAFDSMVAVLDHLLGLVDRDGDWVDGRY